MMMQITHPTTLPASFMTSLLKQRLSQLKPPKKMMKKMVSLNQTPISHFPKRDYSPRMKSAIEYVHRVRKRFANTNNTHVFIRFCDFMAKFQRKQLSVDQVNKSLDDLFRNDPDLYIEFTRFMVDESQEKKKEVVVTSGNTTMRTKSSYVQTLEIWEDYKLEMDLLYQPMKSTFEKLDAVVKQLDRDLELKVDTPICFEAFKPQDFKCIERLYGRVKGEAMVQQLFGNPEVSARILGDRMGEKCGEIRHQMNLTDVMWNQMLEDMRKGVRKVRHSEFLAQVKKEMKIK